MSAIPFVTLDDPRYGEVVRVSPLIRRVVARNPSKFTYLGTGTYLIGEGDDVTVIDPGPLVDSHREALTAALRGQRVRAILVTHCHADHSPLAAWLGETTGAPTLAFGPHGAIDTETELDDEPEPAEESEQESEQESAGEGATPEPKETTDVDFDPDVRLADGTVAAVGHGYTLRAVHTPGHTSNHVCFALEEESALFTGDHIMGWSTTVVSPPDGDMRAYIGSVRKLQGRSDAVLWPTHGAPVTDAAPFLAAYLQHRLHREQQVLDVVRSGIERIPDMVEILYADVRKELHKAAGRSVLAHLVKLVEEGQVAASGVRSASGSPRLVSNFHPDSGC